MTLEERFWSKVGCGVSTACWDWNASKRGKGYGSLRVGSRRDGTSRSESAHRLAWTFTHGPIPDGLCVLHRCDNPPCCNPDHLFLGTVRENNQDRNQKGRTARLTGDNNPSRKKPECLVRGDQHRRPNATITPEAVRDIRTRYGAGETQSSIARDYSLHQVQVSRIVRGTRWGHVK